jgi:hypothetical protein
LITALMFAGDVELRPYQMLPLLIPVVVVVTQIAYPTLLGWAVLFIPSVLYGSAGIYYLVRNATQRPPQWEDDLGGFVMGSVFVGAYLAVCFCLFLARPRSTIIIVAEPSAPPNGGPAPPLCNSSVIGGPPSVS